jgi:hypothetical protein
MLPKYSTIPNKLFLLSSLTCNQILSPLVDDRQPTHLPTSQNLKNKNKTVSNLQPVVFLLWKNLPEIRKIKTERE